MVVHGAVIIEQGVTFAVVVVKQEVTQYTVRATRFRHALAPFFPNMPVILMSQDREGKPHYYGRKEKILWSSSGQCLWTKSLGKPIISIEDQPIHGSGQP